MNKYTFRSELGDYSFSDKQIENNAYLNRREKEIMHNLAKGQSNRNSLIKDEYPSTLSFDDSLYDYKVENKGGRRHLTKTPSKFAFTVDLNEKKWYESMDKFIDRKIKEYKRKNTVKAKEIKREDVRVERSTFSDGTEITKWDRDVKLFR